MEEKVKRIKSLGLKTYQRTSEEEIDLARWWERLRISEECNDLFPSNDISLTRFLNFFVSGKVILHYSLSNGDIATAAWLEQASHAHEHCMYISWWASEPARRTKQFIRQTFAVLDLYTTAVPTLMAFGPVERIEDLQKKLGFVILGSVPNMFNGRDCNVMYITRDLFESSQFYPTGVKLIGE